jgi:Tfp pilus assembly protein PilN
MKAVNLLPQGGGGHGAKRAGFPEPLLVLAIGVTVLVVGAVGYSTHSASSTVAARNATISGLDSQLAALPKAAEQTPASGATTRTAALTTLAQQRTSWDGFLWSISRVVPEDVWVLSLSAQGSAAPSATPGAPVAPVAAAPTGFTVTGYTYSQPSVARMMRRLDLVPWLQDVSLVTSSKTAIANQTVYQFTVGANFVGLPEVGT